MAFRLSYRTSLVAAMGGLVLATGAMVVGHSYWATRQTVRELTESVFHRAAGEMVQRTQGHIAQAIPTIELLRQQYSVDGRPERPQLMAQLTHMLVTNPGLSWVSLSEESGEFNGAYRTDAGKMRRNHSDIIAGKTVLDEQELGMDGVWRPAHHLDDSKYDPRVRDYYKMAKLGKTRVWTPPYVFYRNAVPGITCAAPFVVDGIFKGVFTVDFDLNRLSAFAAQMQVSPHGRVFIFTPDGNLVAHASERVTETGTVGSDGHLLLLAKSHDPVARQVAQAVDWQAFASKDQVWRGTIDQDGAPYLALVAGFELDTHNHAPLVGSAQRWLVGVVAPESDFLGAVQRNTMIAFGLSLVALLVALALAVLLARKVSRPLEQLAGEMARIGDFELDDPPPQATLFREIEAMNEAVGAMKRGLKSFGRYVPRDLVRTLLASGHEAKLGGETKQLTVLFADLAGFTTIAEGMTPPELVGHLGLYLDSMTGTIAAHGGTVDKFIGDGIMAFWGAPQLVHNQAAKACIAAVRAQELLVTLRQSPDGAWLQGVRVRIGLASGSAVVGNIGTDERMNYTALGDTVNLAARLEGLSKHYKTQLLVDEATVLAAGGAVLARPIDLVAPKGKTRAVKIFEVLAVRGEADAATEQVAVLTARAHAAYVGKEFAAAMALYGEVLALRPDDAVAEMFVERCRRWQVTPLPPDWDGSWVAVEK